MIGTGSVVREPNHRIRCPGDVGMIVACVVMSSGCAVILSKARVGVGVCTVSVRMVQERHERGRTRHAGGKHRQADRDGRDEYRPNQGQCTKFFAYAGDLCLTIGVKEASPSPCMVHNPPCTRACYR